MDSTVRGEKIKDQIQTAVTSYANACIETAERVLGKKLEFNEASLLEVDEIIESAWGGDPPVMLDDMVMLWGAFVGECIRTCLGGTWTSSKDFGTHLEGVGGLDVKIFPFAKIQKRFQEGADESISFYFHVLREKIKEAKVAP